MKAKTLIRRLNELVKELGNVEVRIPDEEEYDRRLELIELVHLVTAEGKPIGHMLVLR